VIEVGRARTSHKWLSTRLIRWFAIVIIIHINTPPTPCEWRPRHVALSLCGHYFNQQSSPLAQLCSKGAAPQRG
jgi:hypothetical protein